MKQVTAAILVIGNEILSGRTQDANIQYIAAQLLKINIRTMEVRVVPDIEMEIIEAANHLRTRYDYLFTTGGIGATHDDITASSIAKALGRKIIRDPRAVAIMNQHYKGDPGEVRLRMADIPEGSILIDNPVSAAPGFQIENIFVLAGVPSIAKAMIDGILGRLEGGDPIYSETISAYIAENAIADELALLARKYGHLDIGSYPYFRLGKFGTALVVKGTDKPALDQLAEEIRQIIKSKGIDLLVEDQNIIC